MAEDTQTTRICPLCKKGKLPNRTDAFVERLEKGVTEIQDLIKRLKKGNWKR